jgi:hypothetical protein
MTESTSSQETSTTQFSRIFPQRLSENYKRINLLLRPVRVSSFNNDPDYMENVVLELEQLLNDSLPQTETETLQRVQESLHFHRDPSGYYQHLNDAKLRFLVLWTDYKTITNHFRVRNKIHIRWTGTHYECQIFDKTKRVKQSSRTRDTETTTATQSE